MPPENGSQLNGKYFPGRGATKNDIFGLAFYEE